MPKVKAPSIFKSKFSKDNLIRVYAERISESGAIGIDRVRPVNFSENLADEIKLISSRVYHGEYRFTAYKEKLVSKGANSLPRQLSIPTVRDRVTLRALCECLSEIFPEARLKLPHTVIDSLKSELLSGKYSEFAKIDLQNFYPSIPHKAIESSIGRRTRKPELRSLIRRAISTPTVSESKGSKGASENTRGVPQGLSVSNLLAEISMLKMDGHFSSNKDIWYARYVDDILILTAAGQAESVAQTIIDMLKKMGLSPHPVGPNSKTKISKLTEQFSFLGYLIDGSNVLVRRESILRFESSVAKILTAYTHKVRIAKNSKDKERALAYCRWKINLRITGCIYGGKRMGWVAYFSQINSTSQLRAINKTINKLLHRFKLDAKIKPKSLIKTFYELRRGEKGTHRYIPNFDTLTIAQKRERLAMWLGDSVSKLSDEKVEKILSIKISKAVKDLEADIAQTS